MELTLQIRLLGIGPRMHFRQLICVMYLKFSSREQFRQPRLSLMELVQTLLYDSSLSQQLGRYELLMSSLALSCRKSNGLGSFRLTGVALGSESQLRSCGHTEISRISSSGRTVYLSCRFRCGARVYAKPLQVGNIAISWRREK